MIQNIEKHNNSWHFEFNGVECVFIPMALYTNGLLPLEPNCDNGLRWRIKGKWISYNQIKKAITQNNDRNNTGNTRQPSIKE